MTVFDEYFDYPENYFLMFAYILFRKFVWCRILIGGRWLLLELGTTNRKHFEWIRVKDISYWNNYVGVGIKVLQDINYTTRKCGKCNQIHK